MKTKKISMNTLKTWNWVEHGEANLRLMQLLMLLNLMLSYIKLEIQVTVKYTMNQLAQYQQFIFLFI